VAGSFGRCAVSFVPAPIRFEVIKIDRIAVPMILKAMVRYFAYVFHALLALFLIAVSGLAMASGGGDLRLRMLPW
jgi:hypothetical protein